MKNKYKRAIILIAIVLLLSITGGIYWYYHPTCKEFNDRFVLGNTKENIIAKYGPFDAGVEVSPGEFGRSWYSYFIKTVDIPAYNQACYKYYTIIFDDKGIAIEVRVEIGEYMNGIHVAE